MRVVALSFLPLLLFAQHDTPPPDAAGKDHRLKDPAMIAAGLQLYGNSCGGCHGPDGVGGRGPNLVRQLESHSLKDDELFGVIRNGVPGTDMPPTRLSDDDTWKLAAYLRALTGPAADNKVPGDATAGEAVFWSSKTACSTCHAIRGKGSRMGPDLSNIGGSRPLANIRAALVPRKNDPTRNVALAGKEGVTVTMKSGVVWKGLARNRSNYSMQLIDEKGNLHLISMAEVKSIAILDRSLMPDDYDQRLTSEELTNLLAYLARQTVREGAAQ